MRSGLTSIVSEFRSLVAESAGTVIFSDDDIEKILDRNRTSLYASPLFYVAEKEAGSVIYKNYFLPSGGYLEGTASGTATVSVSNSGGTIVTNYSQFQDIGRFTFDSNTSGTAYYYTGNQFDLFAAAADGWKHKAGYFAGSFDFQIEGRSYKKSQVISQCLAMAGHYSSMSGPKFGDIYNGDF